MFIFTKFVRCWACLFIPFESCTFLTYDCIFSNAVLGPSLSAFSIASLLNFLGPFLATLGAGASEESFLEELGRCLSGKILTLLPSSSVLRYLAALTGLSISEFDY